MTGVTTAATQFNSRNLLGKDWTQTEMERRDKTPHPIRYAINGKYLRVPVCFRAAQLEHYEDHKKMYDSEPMQLEDCCGFHNPQLLELIKWDDVEPPAVPKKKTPPTKGTKQAFVLPKLQFFFEKQAKASFASKPEYNFENLLGELLYNLIIPDEHLWSLCNCIRHEALKDDEGVLTRKDIKETAGKSFTA
ncbi:unnamed protein product [Zymoseptoria tritici ST99CH_1E4]|uniref:Uncharacterized protein n=1 Tax=Zymoseptoria tritici ST99CH_1E4 TaxID=1276532 RepID=A0A2H1H4G5_ZYMTR|nr:unnamed protein product [Zymoseptoria tritici ST99CH_1E4]